MLAGFDKSFRELHATVVLFWQNIAALHSMVSQTIDRLNYQSSAVRAACGNLSHYQSSLSDSIRQFTAEFDAQQQQHGAVLDRSDATLATLKATPLSPVHAMEGRATLGDLLDLGRVATWRRECEEKHTLLSKRVETFNASIANTRHAATSAPVWDPPQIQLTDRLGALTVSRDALQGLAAAIGPELAKLNEMVSAGASAVELFAATPDLSGKIKQYKDAVARQWALWAGGPTSASITAISVDGLNAGREMEAACQAAVNTQHGMAMDTLRVISSRQTDIGSLQKTLVSFSAILVKYRAAFEPLVALEQLHKVYPAFTKEVARRQAWNHSFTRLLTTVGNLTASVHSTEQRARDTFGDAMTPSLSGLLTKLCPGLMEALPLPQIGIAGLPDVGRDAGTHGGDEAVEAVIARLHGLV